jgi:peptidoglycan hydrolase-like protein with peptidoglycan-binding domain
MSQKLLDVPLVTSNRRTTFNFSGFLVASILILLGACAPITQTPVVIEPTDQKNNTELYQYSADPIIPGKIVDVRFAQQALNKLGYKIGAVDGLWGPRSARAIREFEAAADIVSANGHLSELNLYKLEIASGLSRENYGKLTIKSPTGVTAKLNRSIPLSKAPQLIIVDHEYVVLSKPNPYSSELLVLAPGTGIYVISRQDGYYEIESINRKRGYIKVD